MHEGELLVQKRRHTPNELSVSMPNYISRDMPQQHAEFYAGLSYLPLATLDNHGRPWVSILVTTSQDDPTVGIKVSEHNQMEVVAETNAFDPFVRALQQKEGSSHDDGSLFAGVGVDFTNRRRNKVAGSIKSVSLGSAGRVSLNLNTDQHLGNCPKYITVRSLEHQSRDAEIMLNSHEAPTSPLPDRCKSLIDRVSTVFLATKHIPDGKSGNDDQRDMGLNHRGGAPGFVRVYEETEGDAITTYLIIPDHSGNRFYQSLGNIETNKQVGLVFPDFSTGDVLYVTGSADNLFDEEAEAIMPRVGLLTRIQVTGAVFVKDGLNLRLMSDEQYSPYNPPVRYLRRELEQMGHSAEPYEASNNPPSATLVSTQRLSDSITTFTFELSDSIEAPLPGGFGVFDFSRILDSGYSHMNEANPQMVNEDYVRTWTLSNAPGYDAKKSQFSPANQVSVTVKRKTGGLISNFLHDNASQSTQQAERPLQLEFKGSGVGFSCFSLNPEGGSLIIPSKMLWIAGGVGITPFMSMWDGILNVANDPPKTTEQISSDIVLLFSGRDDDISLLKHFLANTSLLPENLTISIFAYQSVKNDPSQAQSAFHALTEEFPDSTLRIEQRRLNVSDFEAVENLLDRDIFLCGPDPLMKL
ncbi:MAG: oxidoreductase, partial [Pseudomonadota bacterium]